MNFQLSHPEHLIFQGPDGRVWRGANQEWYPTAWQRRAGCGPTTAATILAYLGRSRPDLADLAPEEEGSFLPYMEAVWPYVTPGGRGLDDPEGFLLGCRSFALSRHCILRGEILWIPPETAQRPPLTRCRSFLTSALDADCPLAFLNYSNGNLSGLDNWHWVPLVSAKGKKASFPCVILDEGQEGEIDFALWLKTTSLGGALVVLTPEE